MTAGKLRHLRRRHRPTPEVFVESGTYHGTTTRYALNQFLEVHTIELNVAWHRQASFDLGPLGARCHYGNSARIVPELAAKIRAPVFWYLDAHWFATKPDVAGKDVPLPLWTELEAIAQRDYPDVVVVDDASLFGGERPTPEWASISLERIAGYFPGHKEALVLHDQAAVYR